MKNARAYANCMVCATRLCATHTLCLINAIETNCVAAAIESNHWAASLVDCLISQSATSCQA